MRCFYFEKRPDEVENFTVSYTLDSGEDISSVTITTPSGITLDNNTTSGDSVILTVSGGTAGNKYEFLVSIDTDNSRTLEAIATVAVWNK